MDRGLWRGDYQGLASFTYQPTVPEIPVSFSVNSDTQIPIQGTINALTQEVFTIAEFPLQIKLEFTICLLYIPFVGCVLPISITIPVSTEQIGPIIIGSDELVSPTVIDTIISLPIDIAGSGSLGPFTSGFTWQQSPGFFNTTSEPSSGFFNSGGGGASGFLNDASGAVSGIGNAFTQNSGWFNAGGPGLSGLQNFGTLESGWANLGNSLSGVYNTSVLDLMSQAFLSGVGNIGSQISGILGHNGTP
ncbi:PPE family protein PPE34 [Mycobacterium attenuatum]|uniref:PPE family protein n=1 Tax=Mycobacterium attenuatum TaxID=2341086 RepID=UPI000F016D39|nr:PPE family protein [Mycobacterium attenuatum]VBA60866.1 PPE family protein PPE34 [Mycobacterium attenuatum]